MLISFFWAKLYLLKKSTKSRQSGINQEQLRAEIQPQPSILENTISESIQKYQPTFSNKSVGNPNPVLRVTKDGVLIYANSSSSKLLESCNCKRGHIIPDKYREIVLETLKSRTIIETETAFGDTFYSLVFTPSIKLDYVNIYGKDITRLKLTEKLLLKNRKRLADDLEAIQHLQVLHTSFTKKIDFNSLLAEVIVSAIKLSHAEKGALQLIRTGTETLEIVAHQGFEKSFIDFFSNVSHQSSTACALAFRRGERVIVEDITKNTIISGSPHLQVLLDANVQAVQSTPLINRKGQIIGILSTHWSKPHYPEENVLRYLDLLAGQAADIIEYKRFEEQMNAKDNELLLIADSTPIILTRCSKDLRYVFVNKAFTKMFGITQSEIAGKSILEILGKEAFEMVLPYIETVLLGQTVEYEKEIFYNGVGTRFMHIIYVPEKNEKGEVVGWIASIQDVTEHKKVSEALRLSQIKLNQALESANIGLWEWDIKTNTVNWDERTEKMFGLKQGSFGKTFEAFEKLINDEDIEQIKNAFKNLVHKDVFEAIFRTVPINGKIKYISTRGVVKRDLKGDKESVSGVCFDISELKNDTERIISKLNEDVLRSNKDLESFAYIASHDLQEPLRMVTSFTQLLAQQYKDKLDDKAMEYINFAVEGSKRMYELLNGLLSYSRISTKGKEFNKIDLTWVLDCAIKNLTLIIEEKKVIIHSDQLPEINGDGNQMIQLFQNLISNGIKFTTVSPIINISSKDNHDHHVISVKDNGIGIELQYFDRIFQIFQRLNTQDKYEGTGIGLSICKRIVERHGGKIWVESIPGLGSTFSFTIPKNPD